MSTFRDEALNDLRRRIAATNWPEKETVADQSQGVPLAMIQNLAPHWMTGYDWRACEAKLNAVPQFITEIDGLDIHFIHARSQHEDALPLVVNHGWPASIIEQLKIIHRRTNPTAHSASAADALVLRQCRGIGTANAVMAGLWRRPSSECRNCGVVDEDIGVVVAGGDGPVRGGNESSGKKGARGGYLQNPVQQDRGSGPPRLPAWACGQKGRLTARYHVTHSSAQLCGRVLMRC